MTDWVTLRVPAVAYVVGIARAMTVTAATAAGLSAERVDDVRTCTSEAVTNAMQAHRRAQVTLPIVVRTQMSDGAFVVEVGDAGDGLPDGALAEDPAFGQATDLHDLTEGGYGIPVMRELSDSFGVRIGGLLDDTVGTTIRLEFQTDQQDQASPDTTITV